MAPARMVINMLSPNMRVEENVFDFPPTLYVEARRICGGDEGASSRKRGRIVKRKTI